MICKLYRPLISEAPVRYGKSSVTDAGISMVRQQDRGKHASEEKRGYVTLSVPTELYENAKTAIEGTGFRSVTEFTIFLIREAILMKPGKSVRDRLRALGYVE